MPTLSHAFRLTYWPACDRACAFPPIRWRSTPTAKLDERRQRALSRYYVAAGAGGLAVGVHSTQFEIREPEHDLLKPVLELAAEEFDRLTANDDEPFIKVAGVCGNTRAGRARSAACRRPRLRHGSAQPGRHAHRRRRHADRTLAPGGAGDSRSSASTCNPASAGVFFPQASGAGSRRSKTWSPSRWRPSIASRRSTWCAPSPRQAARWIPDNRAAGGIALYTGNDDNIVADLLGDWVFDVSGKPVHAAHRRRPARPLGVLDQGRRRNPQAMPGQACETGDIGNDLMLLNRQVTDMNAAVFDPAHDFHGCIPGMHEVLRTGKACSKARGA